VLSYNIIIFSLPGLYRKPEKHFYAITLYMLLGKEHLYGGLSLVVFFVMENDLEFVIGVIRPKHRCWFLVKACNGC